MESIRILVKNISGNPLPVYSTAGSAGMDLRAFLHEPTRLKPMQRVLVPTGLFMEIPAGYEGQVRPRSGLAINHGITCLNTPGTIDSDYRGELKVILINLGDQEFIISNNDRIAQLVIQKTEQATLLVVEEIDNTGRGHGGFGHTGTE